MEVSVRMVTEDDASALTALLVANRDFLAPWEPTRSDAYFTEAHQRNELRRAVSSAAAGTAWPGVIVVDDRLAGRITIHNIVRRAFESGDLGYWVGQESNGRGVATTAVAEVLRFAFADLGLHRLQAGTLVHNVASQRVLARNGFTRIGLAPQYLRIAGRWQDHLLFQRLSTRPT